MEISAQDAFDIVFFENLIRRDRSNATALELLGGHYSKYGMKTQALRIDRRLVRLRPADSRIRYNFACSLALVGKRQEAIEALLEAIDLGYRDWQWLKQDPDLESLKGCPRFEELVRKVAA